MIKSSAQTYKWNQWVSGELIVNKDNSIIHIVEGDTVFRRPERDSGRRRQQQANSGRGILS